MPSPGDPALSPSDLGLEFREEGPSLKKMEGASKRVDGTNERWEELVIRGVRRGQDLLKPSDLQARHTET